jgi:hypothetical protein
MATNRIFLLVAILNKLHKTSAENDPEYSVASNRSINGEINGYLG